MAENRKLLAIYAYMDDVLQVLASLKAEKVPVINVYSPAAHEPLERALSIKPSPVRRIVLFGAAFGALFGFGLACYAATRWNFIVWGRHPIAPVPYVIPTFEFCILIGVLSGITGFLILARMPRFKTPEHFDARFTVDRYGILLSCPSGQTERISGLLRQSGAEEVRDVRV